MKLATWNVNSVRARHDRLLAFLARHQPDVVCLQETKVLEEGFPREGLRGAGYQSAAVGQKTYNGVAILSREPCRDVAKSFADGGDDSEARIVAATVGFVLICKGVTP